MASGENGEGAGACVPCRAGGGTPRNIEPGRTFRTRPAGTRPEPGRPVRRRDQSSTAGVSTGSSGGSGRGGAGSTNPGYGASGARDPGWGSGAVPGIAAPGTGTVPGVGSASGAAASSAGSAPLQPVRATAIQIGLPNLVHTLFIAAFAAVLETYPWSRAGGYRRSQVQGRDQAERPTAGAGWVCRAGAEPSIGAEHRGQKTLTARVRVRLAGVRNVPWIRGSRRFRGPAPTAPMRSRRRRSE
jgi:hypothetical protein